MGTEQCGSSRGSIVNTMTKEQVACWTLMANSLRSVLPFIEAVANSKCTGPLGDLPHRELAYGLGYVVALEESVRPTQQRKLVN
jgi:hypothetical protein